MSRRQVGGKGESLVRMADARLPVPPGAVLATDFLEPWLEQVRADPAWQELVQANPEERVSRCAAVKRLAASLEWTREQRAQLEALHRALGCPEDSARFAVRSSAREEDSEEASFAGIFESRLGVRWNRVGDAVRECFVASFDARVVAYALERGLDASSISLAVVVQHQLESDVAGVGFSIDPVSNDHDLAVFDAAWGLGSAVVDGRVEPDHYVVSKLDGEPIEKRLGSKRLRIQLDAAGGVAERACELAEQETLSPAQLCELVALLQRVEALFEMPVDIEWAYEGSVLHVLQARPITTYVPLPRELRTLPGERRRLYADGALSKGMTTNEPISALGLDVMSISFDRLIASWLGPAESDPSLDDRLILYAGNRMYMNLSGVLWAASPASLAKGSEPNDRLMAEILRGVEAERYRAPVRPRWLRLRMLGRIPGLLFGLRRFFWRVLQAAVSPERTHRVYQREVAAFEAQLRRQIDAAPSFHAFRRWFEARFASQMFDRVMPVLVVGLASAGVLGRPRSDAERHRMDALRRGVPGNVVVEMGVAMHRLARLLERSAPGTLAERARRLAESGMPDEVQRAWDAFIARFGWRGPQEMDLASPRYADLPELALRQITMMSVQEGDFDLEATQHRHAREREQARNALMQSFGPMRRWMLRRIDRWIEAFAGTRDTPKHLMALYTYGLRVQALQAGEQLVREGRLDAPDHVFDLRVSELEGAVSAQPHQLDLRELHRERAESRRRLRRRVRAFPQVVDSRGRILRPVEPAEHALDSDDNPLLRGTPVSPGIVTGSVKVLHRADAKPIEPGDVLVAYTTDPGWTPLFVNAAAIVLEIGGVLQHGAVVAREYGKPCVVGIDRVVDRLRDGQRVRVDGTAGTIQLLEPLIASAHSGSADRCSEGEPRGPMDQIGEGADGAGGRHQSEVGPGGDAV